MDIIKKNKLLVWAVIVLVLLNLLSVGTFWFGFLLHKPPPMMPMHGPEEMMIHELGLSQQQQEAFKFEQQKHFERVKSLLDSVRVLKHEAFSLLISQPQDTVRAELLFNKTAEYMKQADKMRYEHFIVLRKLCNAEQLKAFDRLLQDMLEQMPPPKSGMFKHEKF